MIQNQHGHWKAWLRTREKENKGCIPLILHIGMEKTGSKAIQTWLADQREELAKKVGTYQRTWDQSIIDRLHFWATTAIDVMMVLKEGG